MSENKPKILVTGGAGYVGSVLISELIKNGYFVKCLDRFFFGKEHLENKSEDIELIRDDIRWFDPKVLENVEAVIDLAAISNDPAGELDPNKTYDINHLGRARVARLAKKAGVKQYILASSASNYGQNKDIVTEESEVNPLTTYSKANRLAEVDMLPLNDDKFTVTVLRFSSLYGISQRMRFDLAVNIMTLNLFRTGKLTVGGDGKQWRPLMHVKDAARAYLTILKAPREKIAGEIFNVGSDEQNYTMHDLATVIGNASGKNYEIEFQGTNDHRTYNMSSKKIKEKLGFVTKHAVDEAVKEIFGELESGILKDSIKTRTVEWYKHILESNRLVNEVILRETIL